MSPAPSARAHIQSVRPTMTGAYVRIACASCNTEYEAYQPTLIGVAVGRHICPKCAAAAEVTPDEFRAAFDCEFPEPTRDELIQRTNEATRIAEEWHQAAFVERALEHRGVPLGEAAERFLVADVALGILLAERSGRGNS